MFLNYDYAKAHLTSNANKHVGRRVSSGYWCRYDKENDRFVVVSTHQYLMNPLTNRYDIERDKAKWPQTPIAYLNSDGSVYLNADTSQALLRRVWGIRKRTAKGKATEGFEFAIAGSPFTPVGLLDQWVTLTDSKIVPDRTPRVRKVDTSARRDLQAKIREVKFHVGVRGKLGAFNNTLDTFFAEMKQSGTWGKPEFLLMYRITSMEGAKELHKVIMGIDTSDIASMHKLVIPAVLWWERSRYIVDQSIRGTNCHKAVNAFLDARRPHMYKAIGIDRFVEV